MSFFTGFGVSSLIYYSLNHFFPIPGASKHFEEVDESNFKRRTDTASEDNDRDEMKKAGDSNVSVAVVPV
ncbi:hypothetical protein FRC03_003105 [Tulasnella sp. 419]|nr:hypothetical protein FRC03_003105 [Tulasnella sp. 419]